MLNNGLHAVVRPDRHELFKVHSYGIIPLLVVGATIAGGAVAAKKKKKTEKKAAKRAMALQVAEEKAELSKAGKRGDQFAFGGAQPMVLAIGGAALIGLILVLMKRKK